MADSYKISFTEAGINFPCKENQFVLAALNQSGYKEKLAGCYGGGCGICKVQILSGDYKKVKKMSRAHVTLAEENAGVVLLCCIQPSSNLEIGKT